MKFDSIEKILVDNMSDVAYVRDLDRNLVYINPAAEKLTGFRNTEMKEVKCWEVFGDSELKCKTLCPVDSAILTDQEITHHEGKIHLQDGRSCDMRVAISPLKDGGENIGAVVVMQDISSLREIEKTHVKTLMKLEQERAMFHDGPVALIRWHCSDGWPVEYVSENIETLTGYSKKEWEDGTLLYLDQIHQDDRLLVEDEVRNSIDRTVKEQVLPPYRFIKKDCTTAWLVGYISLVKNEDEEKHLLSGYLVDVTKGKMMERASSIQRDLAVRLGSAKDSNSAVMMTLQACMQIEGVECAGFYLVDEQLQELTLAGHIGLSPAFAELVAHYPRENEQTEIIMAGKPIHVNFSDRVFKRDCVVRNNEGLQALAVIPVLHKGEVVFSLHLASRTLKTFPPFSRNLMELLAAQVGSAVSRFKAESGIRQIRRMIENMFESLDDFIFVLDEQGRILHSNQAVEQRLGYSAEDLYGEPVLRVHPEDRWDEAAEVVKDIIAGKRKTCPIPLKTRAGDLIPVETIISRAEWEGKVLYLGISKDVSKQMRIEEEKQQLEERLFTAVDAIDEGFVLFDREDRLVMTNARFRELYKGFDHLVTPGISYKEILQQGVAAGFYPGAVGNEREWIEERLSNHHKGQGSQVYRYHDGRWVKIAERKTPDGSNVGFRVDITELKETEEKLSAALKEKDVLLQEIHHRVKNNMAVISSLLNLQAKRVGETAAKDALQASKNRIQSMAIVHECLYQSKSASEVDLEKYFKKLANGVARIFSSDEIYADISIDTGGVTLPMNQAIPCGIILNEVITNSFKYAFSAQSEGIIAVTVKRSSGTYLLTVADNGSGFENDLHGTKRKTMGLWLIGLMADQLNGDMDICSINGVEVTVRWGSE